MAVLLAGPSPTGYLGMAFRGQQLTFLIFCAPVVLVLRSLISGVLAGERLGVWAGGLAALWVVHAGFLNYSEYTHESRVISLLMYLVFMYIPLALGALFGWLGGRLAIQYRISWFGSARVWTALAVVGILLTVCAYAVGVGRAASAVQRTDHETESRVYVSGILPSVVSWPYGREMRCAEVSHLDPTGSVVLFTYSRHE